MKMVVEKLTDVNLMRRACSMTIDSESKISLDTIYKSEHSPARTQLFWIELYGIPTFVSVHLVRHKFGVEHFVKSNREDRSSNAGTVGRNSPVNHAMLLNAQAIINISKERLCNKASYETRQVWQYVVKAIRNKDEALFQHCTPKCMYRKMCPEPKSCGWYT